MSAGRQGRPGLLEVTVGGSGFDAGATYGEAVRGLIGEHLDSVIARLGAAGISHGDARGATAPYRDVTRTHAPALADEVDGVAAGAGIEQADAWMLQLRSELTVRPGRDLPECTTLAVTPQRAADGVAFGAQNVDLPPSYRGLLVALRRTPPDAPSLLTITPAGQIGHHGMNEVGLAIFANYLWTAGWAAGVPRYLLTRIALAETDRHAAAAAVTRVPRSGPRNVLLVEGDGAIDLETTPEGVGELEPVDGVLVHANHLESRLAHLDVASPEWLRNSRHRAERMRSLLERPELDVDTVQSALRDRVGVPDAISHHRGDDGVDVETVASTIAVCSERVLLSCVGPPDEGSYERLSVHAEVARAGHEQGDGDGSTR